MQKKLLFFFFFSIGTLCQLAFSTETELFVTLPIAKTFYPIYIGKIQDPKETFADEYLQELHLIMQSDFSVNGRHSVLPFCTEKEKILSSAPDEAYNQAVWKTLNVSYLLKNLIVDKTLHVTLFTTSAGSTRSFRKIQLTGDLNNDRRTIHYLADRILETVYGEKGIASTKILFAKEVPEPNKNPWEWISEIWECDYDGANSHQVTFEKSFCISPLYYPDESENKRFFYISYKQGQPKIQLSTFGDSRGEPFIHLPGNQLLPAISKTGDKIAFISDAAGRADLFVQLIHPEKGLIGKPFQVYSFPRSVQASPSFSPDGKKIAFVSDKDGSPSIYIIELNMNIRSNALPYAACLSKQNRESICPNWAPDGTKIAYSAKTNGIRQVWLYDFEKNEERQLTHGPSHKENPNWAPNSKHIVFNTADPTYSELYIVEIESGKSIKISSGAGKKHYPAWQPR